MKKKYVISFMTYDGNMKSEEVEAHNPIEAERQLKNCRKVFHCAPCNVEQQINSQTNKNEVK